MAIEDDFYKDLKEGMPKKAALKIYGDILGEEFINDYYDKDVDVGEVKVDNKETNEILGEISNKLEDIRFPEEISVKKPDWYKDKEEKGGKIKFPDEIRVSNFPEIKVPEPPKEVSVSRPGWLPDFGKIFEGLKEFFKKTKLSVSVDDQKDPVLVHILDKKNKIVSDFKPEVNVSGGGGGGGAGFTKSAMVEALNDADNQVSVLNALIPSAYDYISLSYTGENITGVTFKSGGASGTTVATLAITYNGSNITSVTRT